MECMARRILPRPAGNAAPGRVLTNKKNKATPPNPPHLASYSIDHFPSLSRTASLQLFRKQLKQEYLYISLYHTDLYESTNTCSLSLFILKQTCIQCVPGSPALPPLYSESPFPLFLQSATHSLQGFSENSSRKLQSLTCHSCWGHVYLRRVWLQYIIQCFLAIGVSGKIYCSKIKISKLSLILSVFW